jgi:hypothetical protein
MVVVLEEAEGQIELGAVGHRLADEWSAEARVKRAEGHPGTVSLEVPSLDSLVSGDGMEVRCPISDEVGFVVRLQTGHCLPGTLEVLV